MTADIDKLDRSWNPQQVLRAMQTRQDRQYYLRQIEQSLQKKWHDPRKDWNDLIMLDEPRVRILDYCIVLKRLGLEEMACIVNG